MLRERDGPEGGSADKASAAEGFGLWWRHRGGSRSGADGNSGIEPTRRLCLCPTGTMSLYISTFVRGANGDSGPRHTERAAAGPATRVAVRSANGRVRCNM